MSDFGINSVLSTFKNQSRIAAFRLNLIFIKLNFSTKWEISKGSNSFFPVPFNSREVKLFTEGRVCSPAN